MTVLSDLAKPCDLTYLVWRLASTRSLYQAAKDALAKKQSAFDCQNRDLTDDVRLLKDRVATMETTIRQQQYTADDKQPAPGLTVKVVSTMLYSPQLAIAWALDHNHPELLTLNTSGFEALAKVLPLDFVTVEHTTAVVIARDLSAAVNEITVAWIATGRHEDSS